MSVFSEKLQSFVTNANIKIAVLSKLSGVDRSFIQKMLSGERIPSDPAVLESLSSALMLTPAERRILKESYSVSKMGEAIYYRRVMVKRLIEDVESHFAQLPYTRNPAPTAASFPDVLPLQGKTAVIDALQLFLQNESSLPSPSLFAVIQPDCEAARVFGSNCRMMSSLRVEHIVCFDNELQYQKENKYNLQCMKSLLPFLFSPCQYSGWFYYDSISSHATHTSVMPWFILGQRGVMALSQDGEKAMLYHTPESVALYQRIFDEIREESLPLFEVQEENSAQFWNSNQWLSLQDSMSYMLDYEPCWGFFFTMDMVEKQLNRDIPNREQVLSFFSSRQQQISLLDKKERKNTSFFTLEGLDYFLATGRITELPEEMYTPLPKAFRAELLRRMLICAQRGNYFPFLLRSKKFRISRRISLMISDDQRLSCSCIHPVRGPMLVILREKSIVYSICDFMEYLQQTGLIYSREESLELLKKRLEEFCSA